MKKILIGIVAISLLGLMGCREQYTCPTYMQDNTMDKIDENV